MRGRVHRQNAAKAGRLAVTQRLSPSIRKSEERTPLGIRRTDSNQPVRADDKALEPLVTEQTLLLFMIVAEQKIHLSGQHDPLAPLHAVGDKAERTERIETQMPPDPTGEEGEGQGMRRRDGDFTTVLRAYGLDVTPGAAEGTHDRLRDRSQRFARSSQRRPLRAPFEKRGSCPVFQGPDAPAEGRLRDMARLRGP